MLYKSQDAAFTAKYVEFAKTSGKLEIGVYVLPKILDEEVARLHLGHLGAKLERLTPKQSEYIGLAPEGPYKSEMLVSLVILPSLFADLVNLRYRY